MEIDLNENAHKKLEKLAKDQGRPVADVLNGLLCGESVPASNGDGSSNASTDFHDSDTDLDQLISSQGVAPQRFDDLVGDFWPEAESVDDFLSARKGWRSKE